MVQELKKKLPHIHEICHKHRINRLWVFGSATNQQEFGPESDVDVLYEFQPIESGRQYLDHHYGMIDDLEELLNRNIDFIEFKPFRNPYFKKEVEQSMELIYEHGKSYQEIPV